MICKLTTILSTVQWCILLSGVACSGSLRGNTEQGEIALNRELQATSITFTLINAATDLAITDVTSNKIISLGNVAANTLNIEVVVAGRKPGSVKMALTGATTINRTEGGTKFSLCANSGSDFKPCKNLMVGKYTLKADLLTGALGTGEQYASATVSFELTSGSAPVMPIAAPVKAPVQAPVMTPVAAPVKAPVQAPVMTPVAAPVKAPVQAPVMTPVQAPVLAPVVPPSSCALPKFVGGWEEWEAYPVSVAEGMGALVGDDMTLVSGFSEAFTKVTKKVFAYNTRDPNAKWREMDDVPVTGFSHAAYAVDKTIMYICGAYVGGTPGPDSPICLKYNSKGAKGQQWSRLPDMPISRGGGGLNHIKETNSLVYSAGATRRDGKTVDFKTTIQLDLDNLSAGWKFQEDIPYEGNHLSHVTAYYLGRARYYWAGGQIKQEEKRGNQNDLVEWDQASKKWIQRADMTLARGHASTSTIAYGCGFLVIGGAINTGDKTSNIAYYGIDTDKWTSIGDLPKKMNTPVCIIVRNFENSDWVYCQAGPVSGEFAYKRKITL